MNCRSQSPAGRSFKPGAPCAQYSCPCDRTFPHRAPFGRAREWSSSGTDRRRESPPRRGSRPLIQVSIAHKRRLPPVLRRGSWPGCCAGRDDQIGPRIRPLLINLVVVQQRAARRLRRCPRLLRSWARRRRAHAVRMSGAASNSLHALDRMQHFDQARMVIVERTEQRAAAHLCAKSPVRGRRGAFRKLSPDSAAASGPTR